MLLFQNPSNYVRGVATSIIRESLRGKNTSINYHTTLFFEDDGSCADPSKFPSFVGKDPNDSATGRSWYTATCEQERDLKIPL